MYKSILILIFHICILGYLISDNKMYAAEFSSSNGTSIKSPNNLRLNTLSYKYSPAYGSDWSNLPNGKEYPRKKYLDSTYFIVSGVNNQQSYINDETVHLKDISLKVQWDNPYDKYQNTLILIRGCNNVLIEDVAIIQLDSDYRASHSILIEDCKNVIIRNSFFSGTLHNYHVRVEGCESVTIDNIEISGYNYGSDGIRCGGGILINNGDSSVNETLYKNGIYTSSPKNLLWCIIQNCYVHDNLSEQDERRNQDGILIQSPSNGIVFNCYFENWKKGDSALDVSHRRTDSIYIDNIFRLERNIFIDCQLIKTPGDSNKSNILFFANNFYINTFTADYHHEYTVYHVHETHVFNQNRSESVFYKLWGIENGRTIFMNSLLYVSDTELHTIIYQSGDSKRHDYQLLEFDYFLYLMQPPVYWVKGKDDYITTWDKWRNSGDRDSHSILLPPENCFFSTSDNDYRIIANSNCDKKGSIEFLNAEVENMKIDKDFYGFSRKSPPSIGAFE